MSKNNPLGLTLEEQKQFEQLYATGGTKPPPSAFDVFQLLTQAASGANAVVQSRDAIQPAADAQARVSAPGGNQVSVNRVNLEGALFVKDPYTGGYRHIRDPQQLELLGLNPDSFTSFKAEQQGRTFKGQATAQSAAQVARGQLGYAAQFGADLTEEELLQQLTGIGRLGTAQTAGLPSASTQDMLRALPDDKLVQYITYLTNNRIRPDLDQLARQEYDRRNFLKQAQQPGQPAPAPGIETAPPPPGGSAADQLAGTVPPPGTIPPPFDPTKQAGWGLIGAKKLEALQVPGIEQFNFQTGGDPARLAAQQFELLKAQTGREIGRARGVGMEELASRGRRGGSLADFQTGLAAKEAGLLGEAKIQATETERKALAAERGQKFNEFMAPRIAQMREFDEKANARVASITGYLNAAKAGLEAKGDDFHVFMTQLGSVFESALAHKAMDIQRQAAEGKIDLQEAQKEIESTKVNLEKLQNDMNEKLNPSALFAVKDEAKKAYITSAVSTILGAAGLGAAIGSAVAPGPSTAIGAGIGLAAGSIMAFADKF